jgi:putative transcription factor
MLCEMCGNDVESTNRVRVEGSVLRLCPDCQRFGVVLDAPPVTPVEGPVPTGRRPVARLPTLSRRMEERDVYKEMPELELAGDWAQRIRRAREQHLWTPEDLGKKLNEKKSVVLKLESGTMHPSDDLVRKIESTLKIRLKADPEKAP